MKVRKNKGLVLTSTMFVMALLSIVSVTVITLSLSQTRQAVRQDRRTQAYYLARSGADSLSRYILNNPSEADGIIGAVKSETNTHFSNGTFEVEVLPGESAGQIIVRGLGNVSGTENTASVVMQQLNGANLIDKAIYSNAPLDISGMEVNGDVQSGGTVNYKTNGSNAFYGHALENTPRVIEVVWPAASPNHSPMTLTVKNQEMTFNTGYSFTRIDVEQNGIMNINAGSSTVRMFIDDLTIDNILNIDAVTGGKVEIYIKNTMTVTTKGVINNSMPHYLFIYLADGAKFTIQANMILNGYIIGPSATVEVQSNGSTTNGAIIANLVQKNDAGQGPNGAVNYFAPPAGYDIGDIVKEYSIVQWQN